MLKKKFIFFHIEYFICIQINETLFVYLAQVLKIHLIFIIIS
jgi:hypothetical protein